MYQIKLILPELLKSSQFCADNNLDQEVKTCKGDSGGPSIIRDFVDGSDQFTIIGITSGGLGGVSCSGKHGVPDWYTFVAHHEVHLTLVLRLCLHNLLLDTFLDPDIHTITSKC